METTTTQVFTYPIYVWYDRAEREKGLDWGRVVQTNQTLFNKLSRATFVTEIVMPLELLLCVVSSLS